MKGYSYGRTTSDIERFMIFRKRTCVSARVPRLEITMKSFFARFIRDESGATAVEYGVIIVFIVLLVIFVIKFYLEPQSIATFNRVGNTVNSFSSTNVFPSD